MDICPERNDMGNGFKKVAPRTTRGTTNEGGNPVLTLLKCLLASFVLTGIMLLLLAFLLFKLSLTEKIVSIAIIVIYVAACFVAGILAGKMLKRRRFLWGFVEGVVYFLVLFVLSIILNGSAAVLADSCFTTFILCAAGGTLGGMLS